MKLLLPPLICCLLLSLPHLAHADEPLPGPGPGLQAERNDTLRLRELRLREAVLRGEISEEEARRLKKFYRHHDALRLQPPHRLASMPGGEPPPQAWRRWRKKQDRLNAPPGRADDDSPD